MESRVIPRQLLQSFNAPFFGILIMVASFQSSGILLSSQNFIMRGRRISAAIAGSVLKSSALRLSGLGALLFFRALVALIISSLEGVMSLSQDPQQLLGCLAQFQEVVCLNFTRPELLCYYISICILCIAASQFAGPLNQFAFL